MLTRTSNIEFVFWQELFSPIVKYFAVQMKNYHTIVKKTFRNFLISPNSTLKFIFLGFIKNFPKLLITTNIRTVKIGLVWVQKQRNE